MTRTSYFLICLIEECAEVIQRVCKALRFGLDEKQKNQTLTNYDRIKYELRDLHTVIWVLNHNNLDLNCTFSSEKEEKLRKYIEYSIELGIVKDEL